MSHMSYTCYAAVLIYNNQKFYNIRTNKNHDQGLRQGLSFKAKDRTKDCQIVLKDNQGPRTKAKDNITACRLAARHTTVQLRHCVSANGTLLLLLLLAELHHATFTRWLQLRCDLDSTSVRRRKFDNYWPTAQHAVMTVVTADDSFVHTLLCPRP